MSIEVLQRLRAEVDDAARARRAELDDLMDRRDALDAAIEALSDDGAGVEIRSRDEFVARFGPLRTSDVVDVMPPVKLPEAPDNAELAASARIAPASQATPNAEQPVTRRERTIIDTVRLHPRGLTLKQIAEESGVSIWTCKKAAQHLARTGQLVAVGTTRSRRFLHPDHCANGTPPDDREDVVLAAMQANANLRTVPEIAEAVGLTGHSVRVALMALTDRGAVQRTTKGPIRYILPGETPPPRKVTPRTRPINPETVERDQLVASHLLAAARYGEVSLADVSRTLQISQYVVRVVATRLVDGGQLQRVGTGRGTRYLPAGAPEKQPPPPPAEPSGGSALERRRAAERAQNGEQAAHAAKGFTSRDCRNMVFKYVMQGVNTREHLLERTTDVLSEEDVDQALSELVSDGTLKVSDYGRYSRVEREHIPGSRAGALKPRFNTAEARRADAKVRELGMLQRVQVVIARRQASNPGAIARHLNADPQEIVAAVDRLVAEGRLLRDEEGELSLARIARRTTPHVEPALAVSTPGRRLEIG